MDFSVDSVFLVWDFANKFRSKYIVFSVTCS